MTRRISPARFRFPRPFVVLIGTIVWLYSGPPSLHAQSNCVPCPAGVIAWWPADGDATDLVGASSGTMENGAGFSPGLAGQAFSLDGYDDVVLLPGTRWGLLDLTNQQFTVAAWVNRDGAGEPAAAVESILDKYGGTSGARTGYAFGLTNGMPGVLLATTADPDFGFHTSEALPFDEWFHVAATYDGATLRLFVNGLERASTPLSGQLLHHDQDAALGNGNADNLNAGFKGLIDECILFERALEQDELAAIHAAAGHGICQNPLLPLITQQPQSQSWPLGYPVTLTVTAESLLPMHYQWLKDGAPLPGATNATLSTPALQESQLGTYTVVVSNTAGDALSDNATVSSREPLFNYLEDFETGSGDWLVENGVWEIGFPTSGPVTNEFGLRAYSGTNCAATVLGGDYVDGTWGRLVSPRFAVPEAGLNPRLEFWHWFRFNRNDSGVVQVREAGTLTWIDLLPVNSASGGGVWSKSAVSLLACAGKEVQVSFKFEASNHYDGWSSTAANDVAEGWYLDRLELKTGAEVLNVPESFESGWGDWYAEGGQWEVGPPAYGPTAAVDGTQCAGTVLAGNYAESVGNGSSDQNSRNGVVSRLVSPRFAVPEAGLNPRLEFWHWFRFNLNDSGVVQVREAGTLTWIDLLPVNSASGGGVWSKSAVSLLACAGKEVQVSFKFEASNHYDGWSSTAANDVAEGWYLDRLELKTGAEVLNVPESFESGWGDWYAEGGQWEVGPPAYGPTAAVDGTQCAGTVLAGNYAESVGNGSSDQNSRNGVVSRLVSPRFAVPEAGLNPRLEFWHWFRFNLNDSGVVQVREAGTLTWIDLLPVNSASGGGVWSKSAVSLLAYAGKEVQVSFKFEASNHYDGWSSTAANDVAEGWYLDRLELKTGAEVLNVPESFESGWGDWYAEGGQWEVGPPAYGPTAAVDGTQCAGTVLAGNYAESVGNGSSDQNSRNGVVSRLVSPRFAVPEAGLNPRLEFWHWFRFNLNDSGVVQVREAGTLTWIDLLPVNSASGGGVWSKSAVSLLAYAGKEVQVSFKFEASNHYDGWSSTAANDVAEGWYLDRLELKTGAEVLNVPESFESGWGDWYAEGGQWEVGPPAYGPTAAVDGTQCAGTVLAGNYAESVGNGSSDQNSRNGVVSRLVSPRFAVPEAGLNPRLEFWHWFRFNLNDSGVVQVREAGTLTWIDLLPVNSASGGGVWSKSAVSLLACAGKEVQVSFKFEASNHYDGWSSTAANDVAEGWYLDVVRLKSGPEIFNDPESFEASWGDWDTDNYALWQIGRPTLGPPVNTYGERAYSPTNCAATLLGAHYAANSIGRLISPSFYIPPLVPGDEFSVRFRQWYQYGTGDSGVVQISTQDASGWSPWETLAVAATNGTSIDWELQSVELTPYQGQQVRLGFLHAANSDGSVGAGWYIDEIEFFQLNLPTVLWTLPENGENDVAAGTTVAATFSRELDPETIHAETFKVETLAGQALTGVRSYRPQDSTASFQPALPLAVPEVYVATLTTGIRSTATNAMRRDYSWWFTTDTNLTLIRTNTVFDPTATNHHGRRLIVAGATLILTGDHHFAGILLTNHARLVARHGILRPGIITVDATSQVIGAGGTLDGAVIHGQLDLAWGAGAELGVTNGLALNGRIRLGDTNGPTASTGTLRFHGTQTLAGTGEVVFGTGITSNALWIATPDSVVSIGSGITLRGGRGMLGAGDPATTTWINHGTILTTQPEAHITVTAGFLNMARVETSAGTVQLASPWHNAGILRVQQNGVLDLGGEYTRDALGLIEAEGAQVRLNGTLDNQGETLELQSGARWALVGRLHGGTVRIGPGDVLLGAGGLLDGVVLHGDLDLAWGPGAELTVVNGLVLNGTAWIGERGTNTAALTTGRLRFQGTQSLSGIGDVVFGSAPQGNALWIEGQNAVLTLDTNVTVRGERGFLGEDPSRQSSLVNRSLILADQPNGEIRVAASPFLNQGVILSPEGAVVVVAQTGDSVAFRSPDPPTPGRTYQWRLNGVNIPGATNAVYQIGSLEGAESGRYSLVVADSNEQNAVSTYPIAVLIVEVPELPSANLFANRVALPATQGVARSHNLGATKEPAEPWHGGKSGGSSVWYSWQVPVSGIATIRTLGSAFDTLLGVYRGHDVAHLTLVARDEDGGGYLTSEVRFNMLAGLEYQIAVDGFAAAQGQFVIAWQHEETEMRLPEILTQPVSKVVTPGDKAVFDVEAVGQDLRYQWFHNGQPLAGATSPLLPLENVTDSHAGVYLARITNPDGLTLVSEAAHLDVAISSNQPSENKFEDLFRHEVTPLQKSGHQRRPHGFVPVSLGSVGNQVLHNFSSTTQEGEPHHDNVIGGASRWLGIKPEADGVLVIDTLNSELDTVLAVYTGTVLTQLHQVASDDNSAPDGVRSLVRFDALAGAQYIVAVDAYRGAQGRIQINWRLGLPPRLTAAAVDHGAGLAPFEPPFVLTAMAGSPLLLQADIAGSGDAMSYQWYLDDRPVEGASELDYRIATLGAAHSGTHSLVASNWFGSVTNIVANLIIFDTPPHVTFEPLLHQADDQWHLQLHSPQPEGAVIEASHDLRCWSPVWTNTAALTPVVIPLDLLQHPHQFYRILWP
jgi:hypothetical protein